MMSVNQKLANIKCSLCDKTFRDRYTVLRQQKLYHKYSDLKCGICLYVSTKKSNLKRHYQLCHNLCSIQDQLGCFICTTCFKWFSCKATLIQHKLLHKAISIGYNCVICGNDKSENHECRFNCSECSRSFSTRLMLNAHSKLHKNIDKVCNSVISSKDLDLVKQQLSDIIIEWTFSRYLL